MKNKYKLLSLNQFNIFIKFINKNEIKRIIPTIKTGKILLLNKLPFNLNDIFIGYTFNIEFFSNIIFTNSIPKITI